MKTIKLTVRLFWGESSSRVLSTTIRACESDRDLIKLAAKNFAALEVCKIKLNYPGAEVETHEVEVSIVTIEDEFSVKL